MRPSLILGLLATLAGGVVLRTPTAAQPRGPALLAPHSEEAARMEAEMFRGVNAKRAQQRLAPLQLSDRLVSLAREHSRHQAARGFFDHTDPDGRTFEQRMKASGLRYRYTGENLFTCENDDNPVHTGVEGWMQSRGHRKNILKREFAQSGVGVWKRGDRYYITQIFLEPPRRPETPTPRGSHP